MFWFWLQAWIAKDENTRRGEIHRLLSGVSGGDVETVAAALPEDARQPLRDLVVALVNWK